jgi:hypothetical protein
MISEAISLWYHSFIHSFVSIIISTTGSLAQYPENMHTSH